MSDFTRGEMPLQDLLDAERWVTECETAGLDYIHGTAADFGLDAAEFKRLRRAAHDLALYRTPAWAAEAVVRRLDCVKLGQTESLRVLDAGAGDGAFCRALLKCGFGPEQITAVEFCERHRKALSGVAKEVYCGWDFRAWEPLIVGWMADVVVMNPPFARSAEFFLAAWSILRPHGQIAMYNRQAFSSSKARLGLHQKYPSAMGVFANRPTHVTSGSKDTWEYAAFYWRKDGDPAPKPWFPIPDGPDDAD